MTETALTARSSRAHYAYDTFTTGLILGDLAFSHTDPGPGDPVPAFDIELLDGGRLTSTTLGPRPLLLVFGSLTCPVTESSGPVLNRLHARFGNRVRFVMVNTREAHPGQLIPQPRSLDEKRAHAASLRAHHRFPFEVAVDGIDGAFHRAMSPKPNSAYLIGPDGVIAYRAHWANDGAGLARAITGLLASGKAYRGRSSAMFGPLLRAIGHLPGIVRRGGSKVARDVWAAVPPFAVMALLTRPLAFLPADTRGPVALALATTLIGLAAYLAWA
jgi:thiol-disulfide isomerase/thioredoxin